MMAVMEEEAVEEEVSFHINDVIIFAVYVSNGS